MIIRTAELKDKRKIYEWLAHSDTTSSMMGPPHFEDHPISTWQEFDNDYIAHYFGHGPDLNGKCFIIEEGTDEIGVICHNELKFTDKETELDIWLKNESVCGKGYGTRALVTLMDQLNQQYNLTTFIIRPSQRNKRAIAAYKKAGFQIIEHPAEKYLKPDELDYDDCVVMIRHINNNEV